MHIKKDDIVMIKIGKDKDKTGKVIKVYPEDNSILVEGLNLVKKHTRTLAQRARPGRSTEGQIITKEAPVSISSVRLVCPACNKPTKVGRKFLESGEKVRVCKKCKEIIDKK